MRASFRFLMTIMLLLALPLQGYAAASMLRCAPSHHGAVQTQQGDHPEVHAAHHAHGADGAQPAHQGAGDVDSSHGKYGCSACAACCVGGALTASPSGVAASSQLHERPLPVPQAFAAFITDGPERPPRTVLA